MNTEPNLSKSVFIHNPNPLALSVPYQEEEKNNQVNTAQNLVEISYTLKEGEYIANGVKVLKLLFETEHSKFYLVMIHTLKKCFVSVICVMVAISATSQVAMSRQRMRWRLD